MYLGPGRTFDDEDLEYLNEADIEDQQRFLKPSPPLPPLLVDSVSGIYLGFDKEVTDDEDTEIEEVEESFVDERPKTSEKKAMSPSEENGTKSNSLWKMFSFKSKQSSKYKVNTQTKTEKNVCFRFLRKVWGKADVCQ